MNALSIVYEEERSLKNLSMQPFGAKMWNLQNIWDIDKMNALSSLLGRTLVKKNIVRVFQILIG
jgi:hypothetical protein